MKNFIEKPQDVIYDTFMKKSINDTTILLVISIVSFLVAFFISKFLLNNLKDSLLNSFFSLKNVETYQISEGVQKVEFEGIEYVSKDIIIVGIDDQTLSKLGKYPFPRRYYDEYILKPIYSITNTNLPKAVFFDIVFSEYSSEEEDKIFINSLSKAKEKVNLIFDYILYFESDMGLKLNQEPNKQRIELLKRFTIPKKNIIGKQLNQQPKRGVLPLEGVITNAWGIGYANIEKLFPESDTYNSIPMIVEYNGNYYPSILLVLLCRYYETTLSNVYVELGKEIKIKNAKVKYPDGTYKIQDIKIPINEKNQFIINYVSRSKKIKGGTITTLSFSDITRIKGLDKLIKDKVLMIGILSYGYGDIWKSPIADEMYGIEHLANGLNNIIMATIQNYPGYIRIVPEVIIIIVSLLLSLASTLILIFNKNIFLSLIEEIGAIVLVVFLAYFLFSQGTNIFGYPVISNAYLVDITTPILSLVLAYIGGQIFIITKERAQRLQIKSMLDSYVSPEVVNILLKNPEKLNLGGEDREVTIFFSDIRGFTSLSEGLTPQELVSLINKYLSRMTDIIMDNQGTVDKYIGDAIMAFWGAPLDDPDHPFKACKASLEMITALKEINSTLPPDKQIDIGIGINTGIATIGNMGSTKKKNYTAMGDTVNLASRLEGVNKLFHTKIIISESTFKRVKDKILARELDLIRVKGKKQPVKIYEVIGFLEDYEGIIKGLGLTTEDIQADV